MEFKREAVEYAEKNSNRKAAERLYVPVKWIRKWKQKIENIWTNSYNKDNEIRRWWDKTTRPTIRKPISWIELWHEIQWTARLE